MALTTCLQLMVNLIEGTVCIFLIFIHNEKIVFRLNTGVKSSLKIMESYYVVVGICLQVLGPCLE